MRLPPPERHGRAIHRFHISLILMLIPLTAVAGDERPATWDMSRAELEAHGLGQYRGDPVPVPAQAPRMNARVGPKAASQGRIFVNFDGANLSGGWDDAQNDVTQIDECVGSFAAYGNGPKRDAVMQAVRNDWAAYNVVVTDSRPASGEYTMNMIGPTNPFGGGVLGIAPVDCDDEQTHSNITFAFFSANDNFDASTQATTIGQEVAHSYGLEHVDEPGDIMNPFNAGGDPIFSDECIGITGGIICGSQHAANCGSSSQQNAHQELLNLFGASAPDDAPPTVQITAPSDGDTFEVGADFDIVVEANDVGSGIEQLVLFYNGDEFQSDATSPYGWGVTNAPEGTYEFYVEAQDVSGNVTTSNTITVTVSSNPSADDGGDAADGGNPGGDGGGTGGGSAGDGGGPGDDGAAFEDGGGGALPPGFGGDEGDLGCACSSDPTGVGGFGWMTLGLGIGLRRRRRPR